MLHKFRMLVLHTIIGLMCVTERESLEIKISVDKKMIFHYANGVATDTKEEKNTTIDSTNTTKYLFTHLPKRNIRASPRIKSQAKDRRGSCVIKLSIDKDTRTRLGSKPIHLAHVVDVSTGTFLACHFCNDSGSKVYKSIRWYKIKRKQDSKEDAGGYFCLAGNVTTALSRGTIHRDKITKYLERGGRLSFFHHLDVSKYGFGYPKPAMDKNFGICMVSKANRSKPVQPWYVGSVLTTYISGVPCRSTLLTDVKHLPVRSDEIDTELCDVPCDDNWMFSAVSRSLMVPVGKTVKLSCPGATVDSLLWWANDSTTLNSLTLLNDTGGRVEVDAFNRLVIRRVRVDDGRKFSCWINGQKRGVIIIAVENPAEAKGGLSYHAPYVYTFFSLHFWVFLSLVVVKASRRWKQVALGGQQSEAHSNGTSSDFPSGGSFYSEDDRSRRRPEYEDVRVDMEGMDTTDSF